MRVSFDHEPSGPGTTLNFGFHIPTAESGSPLTSVAVRFPPGISYATSALGLAECDKARLTHGGIAACPVDSRIGTGTATVRVPFGNRNLRQTVDLTMFVGRTHDEAVEVLYYATGTVPVIAELVFKAELGTATSGNAMVTRLPAITTLPGAPNAAIVGLSSHIDPPGLTYLRTSHGRRIHYHPRGMVLPRCPIGGFRFSATFRFEREPTSDARSRIPC